MSLRAPHALAVGLAALGLAGSAAAGDAPVDAVAKLKRTGVVSCEPSLPFFCRNLHVSCAGQTSLRTFPFRLRASSARGWIESAPGTERFRAPYEDGRVAWDGEGRHVLLRPRATNGYIRLRADGAYRFRHYAGHVGVMSLGRCR